MKVFISWSGDTSHEAAILLREWLPSVLQSVEPYVSSEDTEKGMRWSKRILKELRDSEFGVICLTQDNLSSSWINFEAGAIASRMEHSRVTAILIGLNTTDVEGPLNQFQNTRLNHDDVFKLVKSLNVRLDKDDQLGEVHLKKAFEKWWPDLEEEMASITKPPRTSRIDIERGERDILEEVLRLSRSTAQTLSEVKEHVESSNSTSGYRDLFGAPALKEKEPDGSKFSGDEEEFEPDDELPF